jgi:hypothetical protein
MTKKQEVSKKQWRIALSGMCKVVKMVHPDLSYTEQKKAVQDLWQLWSETSPTTGYDYFDSQFVIWAIMFLTCDAEKLNRFAEVASPEAKAAFYRGAAIVEEQRANVNQDLLDIMLKEQANSVSNTLESLANPDVWERVFGDTDGDPVPELKDNRVLMSMRPDQEGYVKCGDPYCPACNAKFPPEPEVNDA